MANPAQPTVPDASGVPPVNRSAATTPAAVSRSTSDGPTITVTAPTTKWGIHNTDGSEYFPEGSGPDSYGEVEDSADWSIPTYPTEAGGFESYNKVTKPGEVHLVLVKGGTVAKRQSFRQRLDALAASTTLVNILTPGRTFKGYNLTHMEVQRSAEKGAALLQVRCTFTQVRTTVQTRFTNVQDPSAAANTNGGAVQPQSIPANFGVTGNSWE